MRLVLFCLILGTSFVGWAQGNPERNPVSQEQFLQALEIFGGAIAVDIEATPPETFLPSVLNGIPQSGESDLRLKVAYRYRAAGQLGATNEGEFVPYQKITVRIENLTTSDKNNIIEFELAPSLSVKDGWHYASEVRLPPENQSEAILDDIFQISIFSQSLGSVAIHADAQPASSLFRANSEADVIFLFDETLSFGTSRSFFDRFEKRVTIPQTATSTRKAFMKEAQKTPILWEEKALRKTGSIF